MVFILVKHHKKSNISTKSLNIGNQVFCCYHVSVILFDTDVIKYAYNLIAEIKKSLMLKKQKFALLIRKITMSASLTSELLIGQSMCYLFHNKQLGK
ncbi:hypothetical protein NIES2098_01390 [Calothrix sp. NIES-2098]|nr:hypothetical protein NIES2098_01390 [Calothrix sp. NIES-2098]